MGSALDLEDYHPSVLLHCWLGRVTCKFVSKMTYNVSSGTLNPTIPYWSWRISVKGQWPIHCESSVGWRKNKARLVCVSFSALTLMVGWPEGHSALEKSMPVTVGRFCFRTNSEKQTKPGKWLLKRKQVCSGMSTLLVGLDRVTASRQWAVYVCRCTGNVVWVCDGSRWRPGIASAFFPLLYRLAACTDAVFWVDAPRPHIEPCGGRCRVHRSRTSFHDPFNG